MKTKNKEIKFNEVEMCAGMMFIGARLMAPECETEEETLESFKAIQLPIIIVERHKGRFVKDGK
jgi:hypothetical protein